MIQKWIPAYSTKRQNPPSNNTYSRKELENNKPRSKSTIPIQFNSIQFVPAQTPSLRVLQSWNVLAPRSLCTPPTNRKLGLGFRNHYKIWEQWNHTSKGTSAIPNSEQPHPFATLQKAMNGPVRTQKLTTYSAFHRWMWRNRRIRNEEQLKVGKAFEIPRRRAFVECVWSVLQLLGAWYTWSNGLGWGRGCKIGKCRE